MSERNPSLWRARRFACLAWVAGSALSASAQAHPNPRYAEQLMAEGDYYRAISVYKELRFAERDRVEHARLGYQIGKAYRLGGRYALAVETLAPLLEEPALEPALRGLAAHQLGLSYLGMKDAGQAVIWFDYGWEAGHAAVAELLLGFAELDAGETRRAQALFTSASQRGDRRVQVLAVELRARAIRYEQAPERSALVAGALSLVVPGAGQAYTGHWVDAVQAFAFVGAFGFTTYVAYRYEHDREGPYVLTGISGVITGTFHVANIVGAVRSAQYFNLRQRQLVLEDARPAVLGFDF